MLLDPESQMAALLGLVAEEAFHRDSHFASFELIAYNRDEDDVCRELGADRLDC